MPIAQTPKGSVYFAHVPKAGGSTVEDYLLRRFGPLWLHETAFAARGGRQSDIPMPTQHLTARDAALVLPPDLLWSFAVVRDPLARLCSEYRFQTGASRSSRFGFSTWIRIVLGAARRDPRIYDNHIRPQDDIVPASAEVFRLEDGFDGLAARLDAVTGQDTAGQDAGGQDTAGQDAAGQDTAGEGAGVAFGHLLKRAHEPIAIRRQDVALIAGYYAADYDRFGYARPDPAAFPEDPRAALRAAPARAMARLLLARHRRRFLGAAPASVPVPVSAAGQPNRSARSEK